MRFWVNEIPLSAVAGHHVEERRSNGPGISRDASYTPVTPECRERGSPTLETTGRDHSRGSPDFGGGVDYYEYDTLQRERIPMGGNSNEGTARIPNNERVTPSRMNQSRIPPEDQNPRGCSLHSMEPLRDWFCKGADMTSAVEYEAALCQLEEDPPDIRQYNVNIREERWTNFSLEGVRFPAMTVDVIQRGEALAIFERDLIIHFQQISRAAALYIRAVRNVRGLVKNHLHQLSIETQCQSISPNRRNKFGFCARQSDKRMSLRLPRNQIRVVINGNSLMTVVSLRCSNATYDPCQARRTMQNVMSTSSIAQHV